MNWPTFNLTALLDWLDEAAGGLIRLAYLAAGVTAVAVYFGAGQLPATVDAAFNAALPWVLAFALETHTYLTARRVRAAWQDRDRAGLQVNAGVLVVLLAFSAWNQLGYLSGVWQPPHAGPLALPTWLAYTVRALIVPAAFMAAAFLAPLAPPITAQIEGEARATLADVFKIARKQRRQMLKEAQAAGRDMTGALVELVGDPETRRIISHAYNAIRAPEASQRLPAASPAAATVASAAASGVGEPDSEPDPERPRRRIGGGAQHDLAQDASGPMPAVFPARTASGGAVAAAEDAPAAAQDDPVQATEALTGAPVASEARSDASSADEQAQRAHPRGNGRRGGGKKALASYERKAREALRAHRLDQTIALLEQEPNISVKRLAKALKSGESTAKGLRARAFQVIAQRQRQDQQRAAQ